MLIDREQSMPYVVDIPFLIISWKLFYQTPTEKSLHSTMGKAANCSNCVLHQDFPTTQEINSFLNKYVLNNTALRKE